MKNYHINIFYSEDDEGYIADIPDLNPPLTFSSKYLSFAKIINFLTN